MISDASESPPRNCSIAGWSRSNAAATSSPWQLANASIGEALEAAAPLLLDCGGGKRLALVAREGLDVESTVAQFRQEFDEQVTIVRDPHSALAVCYEVEPLGVDTVARRLVDGQPKYIEIASRLHSRMDVDWTAP